MTTDTDTLIATVREVCSQGERAMIELGWTMRDVTWRDRLDALAAELKRYKREAHDWQDHADELSERYTAELERVKAERDDLNELLGEDAGAAWFNQKARLDKALTALREIVYLPDETEAYSYADACVKIARAAIKDIEG